MLATGECFTRHCRDEYRSFPVKVDNPAPETTQQNEEDQVSYGIRLSRYQRGKHGGVCMRRAVSQQYPQ